MSKVITSPIKRWAGSVTIADPLTLPQVKLFEAGLELPESEKAKERIYLSVTDEQALPAIFACVEKWELTNFPDSPSIDNFPMTPRTESHNLIAWIFGEIRKLYLGELDIPNE